MAENPIQVFVHLAYGFGAESWNRRWAKGKILGINEPFPYGYYRADAMGCSVTYSQDHPEAALTKLLRLGIRVLLGFDLVHAWRNREKLLRADVVWTHTESQFLSILFLLRFTKSSRRPKIISQSVWLFDRWHKFSMPKQRLFSWLIRQADILTVHSTENLAVAKRMFPEVRSELVLFGIAADTKIPPVLSAAKNSLNLVSLGNDEHRDWDLLIKATADQRGWNLKIASQRMKPSLIDGAGNIEIVHPKTNDELLALYRWADVIVIYLKPNLHASGITVIEEAALRGIPVICSDAGGLRAYFDDTQVRFVPPLDAAALHRAIADLADDPALQFDLAQNAQDRMGPHGLSSESFVRRHVEISKNLLASDGSA